MRKGNLIVGLVALSIIYIMTAVVAVMVNLGLVPIGERDLGLMMAYIAASSGCAGANILCNSSAISRKVQILLKVSDMTAFMMMAVVVGTCLLRIDEGVEMNVVMMRPMLGLTVGLFIVNLLLVEMFREEGTNDSELKEGGEN